jgi:hydrogenase maturation protease
VPLRFGSNISDHEKCPDRHWESGHIIVLGLGNILLSDEGIGVHTINAIKEQYDFMPAVNIVDGGTMGLDLLPLFQNADRILVIDAVDFKRSAGHIGVIEGDAIPSVLNAKLSAHHIGLSDLLFTAKLMRAKPPEICLIGIQPKSLDVGLEMTEEMKSKIASIIDLAINILTKWGIEFSRQPLFCSPPKITDCRFLS